jgi:L-alanine-DL-glutamate epimerase-like enolase superfamily enzyme
VELRVWRRRDTLTTSVSAANVVHGARTRLFVEIRDGVVAGFGEVSPLEEGLYFDPSADAVCDALTSRAAPKLASIASRERGLPPWSRVHLLSSDERDEVWAFAALEMAVLDFELALTGRSLEESWALNGDDVAEIATTSIVEVDDSFVPPHTAKRIRVKTSAGVDVERSSAAIASWNGEILLDFNGAAGDASEVRRQLSALESRCEIVAVEQPFAPGDLVSHAELARDIDVAVSLDEGVRSLVDMRLIARYGAAQLVCVKVPRVGGLAPARTMLARASELGLRAYVGGFFDSELARRANRLVAASGTREPSDVAEVVASGPAPQRRATGIGVVPSLEGAELALSLEIT